MPNTNRVIYQQFFVTESFRTEVTGVRFDGRVCLPVRVKSGFIHKRLAAFSAEEKFLCQMALGKTKEKL